MGTRRLNRRCGRRRRPWRANQPLKALQERADDGQSPGNPGVTSLTAALQRPSMAAFERSFTERADYELLLELIVVAGGPQRPQRV